MNNKTRLSYFVIVAFLSASLLSTCADDTPSITPDPESTEQPEEKPEKVPDEDKDKTDPDKDSGKDPGKDPGASDDMLEKLHAIYDYANIGPQKVTTVNQLAILTSYCASAEVAGPITVTPAVLNKEEVTLVTLGGTEEKEGQATTMKESQLASFGKPNDYLKAVIKLFATNVVPKEKPVVVTGISLGGMIAQQLIADSLVNADFTLRAIITFGSPITPPLDRNGVKIVRFADKNDKVPQLGELVIRSGMATPGMSKKELKETLDALDEQEKVVRTSQYTDLIQTHALSYIDEPCWGDIDFLADPTKANVLELKAKLTFYPAPKLSEK